LESSMLQRVEEGFPRLPGELREDCAVIWRLFETLSVKDVEGGLSLFHEDGEYRSAFAPSLIDQAERARASHESAAAGLGAS
jgi:ketosteroid isomerase-like protein